MQMHSKYKRETAVSPVVGVMLMLVVTIIIAAVVSAFAGGLADSPKKTPQVYIEGTYSQADGMTITHGGGDALALKDIQFMTTPSELFGGDGEKFAWIINKSIIQKTDGTEIVNNKSGFYNVPSFVAGDTLVISYNNCTDFWKGSAGDAPWALVYNATTGKVEVSNPGVNENARSFWDEDGKIDYFSMYAFGNPDNIGKYFYLDAIDPNGAIIARTKVTITA